MLRTQKEKNVFTCKCLTASACIYERSGERRRKTVRGGERERVSASKSERERERASKQYAHLNLKNTYMGA